MSREQEHSIKPSFIGIGVQKGGTSWLHKQFVAHPEIFVSESRKEIHYFDEYYDRDTSWYEKWFANAGDKKAVGEITPDYIYFEEVAERIQKYDPDMRFIVMLRNPVERAYSHYRMVFQSGQGQKYKHFDDFMTRHPHAFKRGLYAAQLHRWFQCFKPEQFLILTSESVFDGGESLEHAFQSIGGFLNVNAKLFDRSLASKPVGKARSAPRFALVSTIAQKLRILLRDMDMDHIAAKLKTMGLTRQIFGARALDIPPLNDEDRHKWMEAYRADIAALEKMFPK